MVRRSINTLYGEFAVWFSERGLCRLNFPSAGVMGGGGHPTEPADVLKFETWFQLTCGALIDALSGRNPRQLPPIDLSAGTEFQRRVWLALLGIPAGQTRTYQEVAFCLRPRGSARAVGASCGANRIPVLVPCHRVIAAHQRLGGFSAGLEWKVRLLEREGALPLTKTDPQPELALT